MVWIWKRRCPVLNNIQWSHQRAIKTGRKWKEFGIQQWIASLVEYGTLFLVGCCFHRVKCRHVLTTNRNQLPLVSPPYPMDLKFRPYNLHQQRKRNANKTQYNPKKSKQAIKPLNQILFHVLIKRSKTGGRNREQQHN